MKIFEALGWDTREHRTERLRQRNWHGTARTFAWVVFFAFLAALIWTPWFS